MKIIFVTLSLIFYFLWVLPVSALANTENPDQFINIVNPVRISSYTKNLVDSLNAEYEEIKKRNLPATWLLTYEAISSEDVVSTLKEFNKDQELGIFLEVVPQFAQDAQVIYKKTDSWHRANSLFLSGYTQKDRKKLIDTVFEKFKEKFNFYPVSVGAWWVDSYSLEYMKEKYGITANLTCADQFETDGYHLWGQYWNAPFYPNKFHAGMPANNTQSKLDLVTIQWAFRDPLNGYYSSQYSSQDYFTAGLDIGYFEKIINLYSGKNKNAFGQITVGLEGDLNYDDYRGNYAQQMELVNQLRNSGSFQVTTMQQFSNWYRSQFKDGTKSYFTAVDDLLGKAQKIIWYQSPNYRIGLAIDEKESKLTIIDLRTYPDNFKEPYYLSPNFQLDLFINTPSVIDSISDPASRWEINNLKLKSIGDSEPYILTFEDNKFIQLTKDGIVFDGFRDQLKLPVTIQNSPKLNIKKINNLLTIYPKLGFSYGSEGLILQDLSIQATYFMWRPKIRLITQIVIGSLITVSFIILFFIKKKPLVKLKLLLIVFLPFLIGGGILFMTNLQVYSVNQSEIDALEHLAALPYGKVAVMSNGCLICRWYTEYPPPAFAGKKNYVGKLSHKPIVYNSTVFNAKSRQEGRQELGKLGVKYIYIVRYEGYLEAMPFSPGDLNVEKIYENANTQIWKVKTS